MEEEVNQKYIFVSYAHKDRQFVQLELAKRQQEGLVFWYDLSIGAGEDWSETLAEKLAGASSVLYFRSRASEESENCKRELAYAREHGIPIETVKVKGSFASVIAGLFIAFLIFIVLFLTVFRYIPTVVGYKTGSALTKLEEYGYTGYVRYDYSSDYPAGLIMKQFPLERSLTFIPVVLSQSLGPEEALTLVPDTVGSPISDGVRMLAEAGLTKFTVTAGASGETDFGVIQEQSIPGGYKVAKQSNVDLTVASGETPLVFVYNGLEITVPTEEGGSAVIDLAENTVTTEEPYRERTFENAEYIYNDSENDIFIEGKTYDVPVVVTGEGSGRVFFFNCTFHDDVILKTDTREIICGIEGTCTVNGGLYIINDILDATIETPLPKFMLEENWPVTVEHGSGTVFMYALDKGILFNGTEYSFDDCEYFIGSSSKEESVVPLTESGETATMYVLTEYWEKGVQRTRFMASNIRDPRDGMN